MLHVETTYTSDRSTIESISVNMNNFYRAQQCTDIKKHINVFFTRNEACVVCFLLKQNQTRPTRSNHDQP